MLFLSEAGARPLRGGTARTGRRLEATSGERSVGALALARRRTVSKGAGSSDENARSNYNRASSSEDKAEYRRTGTMNLETRRLSVSVNKQRPYGVDPGFSYYHDRYFHYSDYEDAVFVLDATEKRQQLPLSSNAYARCLVAADVRDIRIQEFSAPSLGSQTEHRRPRSSRGTHLDIMDTSPAIVYGRSPEVML